MATMKELRQTVLQRYELESELMRLERGERELEDRVRTCKFEERQAKTALTEYELGGFGTWLDKMRGRFEEKREAYARSLAAAESALRAARREQAQNAARQTQVRAELEPLVQLGDPLELAEALEPEEKQHILQLTAGLSARMLLHALEENRLALENALEWARPETAMGQHRNMQKNLYYAQADGHAAACMGHMERIARCGILLEIHPYFLNPAGYIVGVAAQYGQLDRLNSALKAVTEAKAQASELIRQLDS